MNTDDNTLLAKRLTELANRAWSSSCYTSSDFLNLAQQDVLLRCMEKLPGIPWSLEGGHPACERRMAFFGSEELCGYVQSPPIACVKVYPRSKRFAVQLSHRDYLGALMALGIEREITGDIFLRDGCAYIFCTDTIAPFIAQELISVGKEQVSCEVTQCELPELEVKTERLHINVASERADAVISAVWGMSRTQSAALFSSGKVAVNSRLCENTSLALKDGDTVSVRGCGRFIYRGTDCVTRKGRLFIYVDRLV